MNDTGLRVCSAPGSWAIHHDPAYTRHLMTTPQGEQKRIPGVIITTEAKDYDAKKLLAGFSADLRKDWTALQKTTTPATMGISVFVHRSVEVVDWGIEVGVRPFISGRHIAMLTRYPLWMHLRYQGHSYFPIGCHAPKVVFRALQRPYLNQVRAIAAGHPHAIPVGDWNQQIRPVRKALGMDWTRGHGIVSIHGRHATVPHDADTSLWGIRNKVADHPSESVTVRPRQRERTDHGGHVTRESERER